MSDTLTFKYSHLTALKLGKRIKRCLVMNWKFRWNLLKLFLLVRFVYLERDIGSASVPVAPQDFNSVSTHLWLPSNAIAWPVNMTDGWTNVIHSFTQIQSELTWLPLSSLRQITSWSISLKRCEARAKEIDYFGEGKKIMVEKLVASELERSEASVTVQYSCVCPRHAIPSAQPYWLLGT
jgi:hypothetical protein